MKNFYAYKSLLILLLICLSFTGSGQSTIMIMTPKKNELKKFTLISASKKKILFIIAKDIQVYKDKHLLYLVCLNSIVNNQSIGKENPYSISHIESFHLGIAPRTHITLDGLKVTSNDLLKGFTVYKGSKTPPIVDEKKTNPDLNSYVEETESNETLEDIAKRHSISLEQLKKLNPKIKDGQIIKAGTPVKIMRWEKDEKKHPTKYSGRDFLKDPNVITMSVKPKIFGVSLGVNTKENFKVVQVYKNSPAGKLGIKVGSILLKIDDHPISKMTMKEVIELLKTKDSCAMTFKLKDGKTEVVKIKKGVFTVQDGLNETIFIKPKHKEEHK